MTYKEITYDLFRYIEEHKENGGIAVAHCISRDLAMGAGIAKKFTEYGIKSTLQYFVEHQGSLDGVDSIWTVGNKYNTPLYNVIVHNLITKEHYWEKPTYESITKSIMSMRDSIIKANNYYAGYNNALVVKTLTMPRIGCGLDRLNWETVSNIIKQEFKDTDIDIIVCLQ